MVASAINVVLGLLVTYSAFHLDRSPIDRLLVSAFLGPAIALFSMVGLRFRRATYVVGIAGSCWRSSPRWKDPRGSSSCPT